MDCDYLIVGAGLAGASTAYYLTQQCLGRNGRQPRIVIVEKEPTPGAHSSGRNAALIRRYVEDPAVAALAERGADVLVRSELAEFHATGSMLVGLGDDDASEHFPTATGRGRWCPGDGVIDVAGLLSTYLQGQVIHYEAEVREWHDAGSMALKVVTSTGTFNTRLLVNAAGPWAGELGSLPMAALNRHLFATPPIETVAPDWPFVWDLECGLYFRPESGGLLLCACDETPAPPGVYEEDPQVAIHLADLLRDRQPGLGEIRIMQSWVGQRTFAPDRRFAIGYDPRDRRIFHVAGLGGHGVTTAPAVGALAAELLLNPESPRAKDNPFDPGRLV